MPERIQQRRTKGWRKPANTVSVARPSRWGNPFRVGVTARIVPAVGVLVNVGDAKPVVIRDRAHAVEVYRAAIDRRIWAPGVYPHIPTMREIGTLQGKNLMCFCPLDQPCHADVLIELANPKENQ